MGKWDSQYLLSKESKEILLKLGCLCSWHPAPHWKWGETGPFGDLQSVAAIARAFRDEGQLNGMQWASLRLPTTPRKPDRDRAYCAPVRLCQGAALTFLRRAGPRARSPARQSAA